MAWNQQGPWGSPPSGGNGSGGSGGNGNGGGSGKPGKSPWGRGGSGGNGGGSGGGGSGGGGRRGGTPPDIENLFRLGQDRMRRAMPGGWGSGPGLAVIAIGALLLWAATGVYVVQPDEWGVITRFGRYDRVAPPGWGWHLPAPFEALLKPSQRINRIEIGFRSSTDVRAQSTIPDEGLMLTQDENIIEVHFVVNWHVGDPRAYLFQVRDVEGTVKQVAESAMREVIGETKIQPALTEGREAIQSAARIRLQRVLDAYHAGVTVDSVELQPVQAPGEVREAFDDVQRARQDQQRLANEAEQYANKVVPEAKGEAAKMVQEAEGYRAAVVARAQGEASRFGAVLEAYSQSREVTAERLYLETMQDVLTHSRTLLVDGKSAPALIPYLGLGQGGKPALAPPVPPPGTADPAPLYGPRAATVSGRSAP